MPNQTLLNKEKPKRFRLELVGPIRNGEEPEPTVVGDGIHFRDGVCAYQREGVEMIHVADSTRAIGQMETGVEVRWSTETPSRRFQLYRHQDIGRTSGTGIVAEGIEFEDGQCAYRWLTSPCTTQIAANMASIKDIHTHGGKTEVRWMDK